MAVWPWISTTTTINSEHEPGAHWVLGVQKPEGLPLYPPGKAVSYHQCVTHDSLISTQETRRKAKNQVVTSYTPQPCFNPS